MVSDWTKAWKWFSVQGLAFLSVAPVVYENSSFIQEFVSPVTFHYLTGGLGLLTLVSRLVKQGSQDGD